MDVSPLKSRVLLSALGLGLILVAGCGNRFDLSTERGRQSRIDEANFHLSKGNCSAAHEAIDPAYNSPDVNDEIRLVKASAHGCSGSFNLLTIIGNIAGASNYFSALVRSLANVNGDGALPHFYTAGDVLTRNSVLINASARSTAVNNYMVFIQLGTVAAILRNYGSPGSDGSQGANLVYDGGGGSPAGEMDDLDACALAASLAIITDSYNYSTLRDGDTAALANAINAVCVAAGLASCEVINKSRTACAGGNNADSARAQLVVGALNTAW